MLIPQIVKSQYILFIIVQIFIFAAMSSSWNILGGFAKQISWAHASFFSLGAYSAMLLFQYLKIVPWVGMLVGILVSALWAFIIGLPSFKLRGTYFSLATIACGQMMLQLLVYFDDFTGGASGIAIDSKYKGLAVLRWNDERPYYYLFLFLLIVVLFVVYLVEKGRIGYYLKAIKEDQDAAESLGIRSSRIKMQALLISAVCISVVGSFYAFKTSYIDPNMVTSYDLAIKIGVIAIVGGIGSFWGPVLGALIIIPLMEICNAALPPQLGGLSMAVYGILLVLIVLFRPDGVWSIIVEYIPSKRKVDN